MNISSAEANASIKVPGETTPSDFNLVKGRDIFRGGGGNLLSEEGGPVRIVDFLGQGENVFRDYGIEQKRVLRVSPLVAASDGFST